VTGRGTRQPLIAGNWKMNGNHFEAITLVQKLAFTLNDKDFAATDVAVLPPFTSLRSVQTLVFGDKLRIVYGAQDVSPRANGAYTGDISATMLAKLGCTYVLAGHSERRQHHGEDDALVNAKVKVITGAEMVPILCVGETLEIRQEGRHLEHVSSQLDGGLAGLPAEQVAGLVVAYEPVWAIGTGEVATPADAQEVCAALRATLGRLYGPGVAGSARLLYGGSVKPDNIAGIMAESDVDGALVGGASLSPEDFVRITRFHA